MAHYVDESFKTFVAAVNIPAYSAVKTDANGKVVPAAAGTDLIVGVIHAAVKAGFPIDVRLRNSDGTSNVMVGTVAVAKDAPITSDANGLAITTSTAGHQILGYALEAGAAGKVIEFMPSTGKF